MEEGTGCRDEDMQDTVCIAEPAQGGLNDAQASNPALTLEGPLKACWGLLESESPG